MLTGFIAAIAASVVLAVSPHTAPAVAEGSVSYTLTAIGYNGSDDVVWVAPDIESVDGPGFLEAFGRSIEVGTPRDIIGYAEPPQVVVHPDAPIHCYLITRTDLEGRTLTVSTDC